MFETLINLADSNFILSSFIFILLRTITIMIPVFPGFILDFTGMFAFGWLIGFIYAEIGIMIGSCLAFWIGRKLKEPTLRHFISLKKLHKYEKEISHSKKFIALTLIRIPTNSILGYLNYLLGLTNIPFKTFFFSTLIGNIPGMLLFYYFGNLAVKSGIYYFISFILVLIILYLIFKNHEK